LQAHVGTELRVLLVEGVCKLVVTELLRCPELPILLAHLHRLQLRLQVGKLARLPKLRAELAVSLPKPKRLHRHLGVR
jgi:hypothetical protein